MEEAHLACAKKKARREGRLIVFIERTFKVRYSDVHVWRLLGQMGFSSQKPERRALERDEVAIQAWKKRTWPALKKRPIERGG